MPYHSYATYHAYMKNVGTKGVFFTKTLLMSRFINKRILGTVFKIFPIKRQRPFYIYTPFKKIAFMIIEQEGLLCLCATFFKVNLPYLPSTIASTSLTCNDGESNVYLVPGRQASQCTAKAEKEEDNQIQYRSQKYKTKIKMFFLSTFLFCY